MDLIRPTWLVSLPCATADTASQHVFRQHLQEAQGVYTEHVPMSVSAMREARRCGAHPAMTGVRVANRVLRPAAQSLPGARGFLSALMRRFRDGYLPRDTNDVETSVVDPRRRRHGRDWRPGRSIDVRLFLGFFTTTRASAFFILHELERTPLTFTFLSASLPTVRRGRRLLRRAQRAPHP